MKQLLPYILITGLTVLLAAAPARSQNSGFINQQDARNKWSITGTVNPPLTNVKAIYPHPGRDVVDILLAEKAYQPVDVWVLDMNGTVIKTFRFQPEGNLMTIDVSNLPRGQYALHVKEAGREVQKMVLVRED